MGKINHVTHYCQCDEISNVSFSVLLSFIYQQGDFVSNYSSVHFFVSFKEGDS